MAHHPNNGGAAGDNLPLTGSPGGIMSPTGNELCGVMMDVIAVGVGGGVTHTEGNGFEWTLVSANNVTPANNAVAVFGVGTLAVCVADSSAIG